MENEKRLIDLCLSAANRRNLGKEYLDRLKLEIKEIKSQKEIDYFLDLYDRKVRYPRNQNNLLVPYLLGVVSEFDISREPSYIYGEFPDIDVDYIDEVRDYLKNVWAPQQFGRDKVCNIGSYGTYAMRSSLLDVAKVYGKDRDEMLLVTKTLPNKDEDGNAITWEQALKLDPALKEFCEREENKEIYEVARRLSESPHGKRNKNMGKHAGGLIISCKSLNNFIPLVIDSDGLITSAFTEGQHAQELGPLGYVKLDCLSIANLKQIAYICHLVKQRHKIDGICNLPGQKDWSNTDYLNDPKSLEMANRGDLKCIYQFDANPGIRMLARDGGVTNFDDLVAYTSVFRPAALSMGMDKLYVRRKKGEEEYEIHPLMEPIVGRTYGIMIYQEQVMQILNAVGDVPLRDCEKVRKAISKKKMEVFGKYKEQFLKVGSERLRRDCKIEQPQNFRTVINQLFDPEKSLEENEAKVADHAFYETMPTPYPKAMGYVAALYKLKYPEKFEELKANNPREYLSKVVAAANCRFLWDQIEAFAGYGFNKSHAVAYTYISSRLLYLKAHYPLEFYAGILMFETKEEKIKEYKTEALIHKVGIKPVDINRSGVRFSIHQQGEEPSSKDEIYFGLANIKGVGDAVAQKIVQGRPYTSFDSFLMKFGTEANVIKPLLSLRIFTDDEPEILYMYYEDFKVAAKSRVDRARRQEKTIERYDQELRDLLKGDESLMRWDECMLPIWEEAFNVDEMVEELCVKPGPNYGQTVTKKFNRWKRLKALYNKRKKSIDEFLLKEKEAEENPFTLDKFKPELSQVHIAQDLKDLFHDKEAAEHKYLGFRWDHPLEKSPDFTGKTFSQLRTDEGGIAGPVEVLLIEYKKKEWKSGKGFNYALIVEDANGERGSVTVWPDDWERFKDDFLQHNLFRLRLQPPSKYGYTLDGPPKWKRHQLPDKDRDYRVVKLKSGENNE